MNEEVKNYQKGFLDSIGLTVTEALNVSDDDLWSIIFGFCSLNDVLLILEEPERLLLASFCDLEINERIKITNKFHQKVLNLKKELNSNGTI